MEQHNKELTITRIFNAPRELVFKAWTDADQLAQWWGPHGFTNPVCKVDARPGGAIYIDMTGPDGQVHPMDGTYNEVVEPERLVFTSHALDDRGVPLFEIRNTVTFKDIGGKTEITMHAVITKTTPEAAPYLAGMNEGWKQTLDKFDAFAAEPIIIERMLNATAGNVWSAVSDKDEMRKWYFDLKEFKPVVGFEFEFYGGPPEKQYQHLCKVTEVIPGKKLTYSWRYGGYPGNSFVTFELFPEAGNKTRIRLTHIGLMTFPANEQAFAKHNFVQGWTQIIGTSLMDFFDKA